MFNFIYRRRSSKNISDCKEIAPSDISKSQSILFCIFSRYGDSMIALSGILEFAQLYTRKSIAICTPPQLVPYIKEFLPDATIIPFRKRNIFDFVRVTVFLYFKKIDIGLNPYSYGAESEFLISFCKKFLFFKQQKHVDNLYNGVRSYLRVPTNFDFREPQKKLPDLKNPSIIIAPESSERQKSLSVENLKTLIHFLKDNFGNHSNIVIASDGTNYDSIDCEKFYFTKTSRSSEGFLAILKKSDMLVSVDSGPLHIGILLKKPIIALFSTTHPEWILHHNNNIFIYRMGAMNGFHCENKVCQTHRCMNELLVDLANNFYVPLVSNHATRGNQCCYKDLDAI